MALVDLVTSDRAVQDVFGLHKKLSKYLEALRSVYGQRVLADETTPYDPLRKAAYRVGHEAFIELRSVMLNKAATSKARMFTEKRDSG